MVEIGIELCFAILARPCSWDAGFGYFIGATYFAEGKSLRSPVEFGSAGDLGQKTMRVGCLKHHRVDFGDVKLCNVKK